eukprot:1160867-Pelagomonas_calceolata.AAC.2
MQNQVKQDGQGLMQGVEGDCHHMSAVLQVSEASLKGWQMLYQRLKRQTSECLRETSSKGEHRK